MPSWPAKDPSAVKDYLYTIPLDDGDSVSAHTFEKLSGTVAIDSESRAGADVKAWLSGGTDGEVTVFRIAWTTAGGRSDDVIITLPVADNELTELTGYDRPAPAHLIARYPAFAAVDPGTIRLWLTDAERIVKEDWLQPDYAVGIMAKAADSMAKLGIGATGVGTGDMEGVTDFKSASFSVSFDAGAVASAAAGVTPYGREFAILMRRNSGGPRLVGHVC